MPIGPPTFNVIRGFGFPRSYIDDFLLYQNGDTFSQVAGLITVFDVYPSTITATFRINPHFFPWTSNGWTIDHIIVDSYYQLYTGYPPTPLPYNLDYHVDPTTGRSGLYLGWSGFRSDPIAIAWPAQPSNYWLPKPL